MGAQTDRQTDSSDPIIIMIRRHTQQNVTKNTQDGLLISFSRLVLYVQRGAFDGAGRRATGNEQQRSHGTDAARMGSRRPLTTSKHIRPCFNDIHSAAINKTKKASVKYVPAQYSKHCGAQRPVNSTVFLRPVRLQQIQPASADANNRLSRL